MKTEQDILIKISELELLIGKAERENRTIRDEKPPERSLFPDFS